MPKSSLFFVLFILLGTNGLSQDYYFEDFVYSENIKTVTFTPAGNPVEFPVVQLGTGDRLRLAFDDLDVQDKRYTYRIIHCDRNWKPSELDEVEYLDGFNGEEIRDSYHSISTKIPYVHYELILPNEYVRWTLSGNYLLVIFDEDNYPIISKRFLVVDPRVSVLADFISPKKVSELKTHQSLEITIDHEGLYVRDPLSEISVTVLQNFRWLDAVKDKKPKNIMGTRLLFDPFEPFTFPALKEFRNFDIRSLLYTSRYVYSIRATTNRIEVLLEKEKKRTYTHFISEPDANGLFVPDSQDNPHGIRGAEYVNVGFTLESPLPFEDYDVYVIGGFSDWQIYETNRMDYDATQGYYVADILLKQGYYDYYYALVDREGNVDLSTLEGNWYETDNNYYVLVYLREFGSYYDKLIALYTVKYF
jgi:hypothetical protein